MVVGVFITSFCHADEKKQRNVVCVVGVGRGGWEHSLPPSLSLDQNSYEIKKTSQITGSIRETENASSNPADNRDDIHRFVARVIVIISLHFCSSSPFI